jgi:hypothetical protein
VAVSTTICIITDASLLITRPADRTAGSDEIELSHRALSAPATLNGDASPELLAAQIAEALPDEVPRPVELDLVIPLQWCFAHVLDASQAGNDHDALAYSLEEYLPLPLEDVTVDFIRGRDGTVLALAVPTAPMQSLLSGLQELQIEVNRVLVDAVTLQQHSGSHMCILDQQWIRLLTVDEEKAPGVVAIFARPDGGSLVETIQEQRTLRSLPADDNESSWLIADLEGSSPPGELATALEIDANRLEAIAADEYARTLTIASRTSTHDLRRGALARPGRHATLHKLGQRCLVAVICLFLTVTAGMRLHITQLRQHQTEVNAARLATYQQVFSVERLLPGAALRLASERVRIEGLTQSRTAEPAVAGCPLDALREVVTHLPQDVRIMLASIQVNEQQLILRGQTTEHREAERIADAVNKTGQFEARSPRTNRLKNGGVEFAIYASKVEAP